MNLNFITSLLFFCVLGVLKAQTIDSVFTTQNSGISYNIVNAINCDLNNRLFIGTEYGLTIYENEIWQIWREDESAIPENTIRTLYNDAQNKLWIGGFSKLPSVLNGDSLVGFALQQELSNHVKDILVIKRGEEELLYMATESGLGIYNFTTEDWQILNLNSAYIESPNFTSLAYNEAIGLCAGTLNGGFVIVRDNGQVETYFGDAVIPDNTILDIAIDENNLIWLASPAGGLLTFDGSSFESITPFNSNIHSEFISCLWLVNSKEIWFGTNAKGIGHLKDGKFSNYDSYNSKLLNDKINDLHLQNDSILWVATDVGLAKLCIFDKMLTNSTISKISDLVYPNPATSTVNIKQQYYNEVFIYDNTGKIVFHSNLYLKQIDVAHFKPGLYYIALKFNNSLSVNKLSIL